MLLAVKFAIAVKMPAQDANPLGKVRLGEQFVRAQQVGGAAENPRIVERASTDAHAGAARLRDHVTRGLGRGDVAVADDGDAADGCDDGADTGEVDGAGEALRAGAAVHKDCGDAGVFEDAREVGGGEVVVVPAEPHLGGDGDFHGVDHPAHEGGGLVELGHHRGAAADLRHLFHGAAHVDVDGLRAEFLAQDGGVAHLLGHTAEQLDGHRPVCGRRRDEFEGGGVAFEERAGVDEVGGGPTETAELAHGDAHGQVGVTGERGQKEVRGKLVRSEAHGQRAPSGRRKRKSRVMTRPAVRMKRLSCSQSELRRSAGGVRRLARQTS